MFSIKWRQKPFTKKTLAAMAIDRVKKDRIAFTHGMGYYRQVVIYLGERELLYYRPFLQELCEALNNDLGVWYERQNSEVKPQLVLARGKGQTTVAGSFEVNSVPDLLAGGQS